MDLGSCGEETGTMSISSELIDRLLCSMCLVLFVNVLASGQMSFEIQFGQLNALAEEKDANICIFDYMRSDSQLDRHPCQDSPFDRLYDGSKRERDTERTRNHSHFTSTEIRTRSEFGE